MSANTREFALVCESVKKVYRHSFFKKTATTALNNVSLSVPEGGIFGILGPNGAGKTTLINVFAAQLPVESGEVYVLGNKLSALSSRRIRQLKAQMNMCSGAPNFPWSFTVNEVLVFYAMLYGMAAKKRNRIIAEYVELLELKQYLHSAFDTLSSGTKQRVALAKALLNEPRILFLDEPTLGLDVDIARKIRAIIVDVNRRWKNTIILTTHYMKEAEELCERIAFIKDGAIKTVGTSSELKKLTHSADLEEVFLELLH